MDTNINSTIKFNGFMDFGHNSWDPDKAKTLFEQLKNMVFEDGVESKSHRIHKIAVKIERCSDEGIILDSNIYIYECYDDALFRINKFQYMKNYEVEVFELTKDSRYDSPVFTFRHMMMKTYDGDSYFRLANPTSQRIELFNLRKFYDKETVFYIYR